MKQFEYQTVTINAKGSFMGGKFEAGALDSTLNAMGREGWELVETVASNQGHGDTRCLIFIFKRERN